MIIINNWSSFQSYKDRKPPWIRLHKSLLDNYEFHSMSANARALLPMLWLLASEDEDPVSGAIRYCYEKISFRLRLPLKDVKTAIEELSKTNNDGESFIQINQSCNETVTESLRIRTQTVPSETETEAYKPETETPLSGKPDSSSNGFSPDDMATIWNERVSQRSKAFDGEKDVPKILKLTTDRRKLCQVRIKSLALNREKWGDVMDGIFRSKFLVGVNDRGWVANFDWITRNDKNVLRVVEGW